MEDINIFVIILLVAAILAHAIVDMYLCTIDGLDCEGASYGYNNHL